MKNLFLIVLLTSFLFSCQKDIPIVYNQEAVFNSDLPSYPIVYLLIIEQEYEMLLAENRMPFSRLQYFENRISDWFPELSVKGKLSASIEEVIAFEKKFSDLSMLSDDSIFISEDKIPISNFEYDSSFLKLSKKELAQFNFLNVIARENYDKSSVDSILFLPNRYLLFGFQFLYIPLHISIISKYPVFPIYLSYHRAIEKMNYYYPNSKSNGCKGDAFRHVFASMHLRRYLGRLASALIMSSYEQVFPNPIKRDTYMDLHNNKLGRHKRYRKFRGHLFNDSHDWEKWAKNVKVFIDDDSNGVDMDWELNVNTNYLKEAQEVNSKYYIYYR